MSSRRRGSKDAVKVVIINTEYVETDARSFKSVVQNLTGKDSIISASAAADQQPLPMRQPAVRSMLQGHRCCPGECRSMNSKE
ncbi:hypothetical protein MIMGU_mgv1a023720mg [Erythranthe guttata]|uniref:VQ domain-containing protein n=1 Tax=Erythranthe guttata TaxID=4155 RepID=A0A022QI93_ERYGU|nr:hypothetical protein MIMGU_mgv1a023720mg [Erythranthe guttata]